MPLRLEEVDFSDGAELALVQTAAQAEDELNQALHPGLSFDAALAATKARWPSVYGFGSWHYKKVVDVETGKIVSFSRWATDEEYRRYLPPLTGSVAPPAFSLSLPRLTATNRRARWIGAPAMEKARVSQPRAGCSA